MIKLGETSYLDDSIATNVSLYEINVLKNQEFIMIKINTVPLESATRKIRYYSK
ncbi:hypothetical protein OFR75_02280 [Brachyspira hyodysenteriae]|nr:hypothetical protein [Brachyspira hyodysenteriae]